MNYKLNQLLTEKRELEVLCVELQKNVLTPERLEFIKCEVCIIE